MLLLYCERPMNRECSYGNTITLSIIFYSSATLTILLHLWLLDPLVGELEPIPAVVGDLM